MKNLHTWKPTKFEIAGSKLRASRNTAEVGLGSRLMVDLIGAAYSKHIPVNCRGKLLDLGCGRVPLYGFYKDFVSDVTCVDWAETSHGQEHLDHVQDINQALPLESGTFDTVICSDVFEHLHSPRVTIKEIARVLKNDGVLLLNCPFLYWLHEEPHDYHRYTRYAIERYCSEAGLKVLALESYGGSVNVIIDILAKKVAKRPIFGSVLARVINTIPLIMRGFLPRDHERFPLFYFLLATKNDLERNG